MDLLSTHIFVTIFDIPEKELLELLAEINDSLSENDFGFKIKYNDLNSDFLNQQPN